jgi:site-specific DNA-methyltransferase (adenine-specific)
MDCLEGLKQLPDGSVDLIVTDPPYGMSFVSNYRKKKYKPIENDKDLKWLPSFIEKSYRVLKKNSNIYVFCSKHNISEFIQQIEKLFTVKNIIVWVKNNTSMGDLKGSYADKTEFVIFACKGKSTLRGFRGNNVLEFDRTGNKHHPTEKNVEMIKLFIEKSSDEGGVVLDPFMGSGTTALACKQLRRKYIGFEIDSNYVEIAQKRLSQEVLFPLAEQQEGGNGIPHQTILFEKN